MKSKSAELVRAALEDPTLMASIELEVDKVAKVDIVPHIRGLLKDFDTVNNEIESARANYAAIANVMRGSSKRRQ